MLPFKVKKWQLWLLIVYLTVITSTSWQCDPRQTSCGDGATGCLIKKGESAKGFTWKGYCDGYCYACFGECENRHFKYVYDDNGVSITQKCGYRAEDYIEPVCVSTLNNACPGLSNILLQYNLRGVRPCYQALVKECPRLGTMVTEQVFNSCIEDMKAATENAKESDDEACYNYFIRGRKCDGSAVDSDKRWTGETVSIVEVILQTFFHITCNEENTCYDNCSEYIQNISEPSEDGGNDPGGNDPGDPGDNGNYDDYWTLLNNSPQSGSVVKGEPVIFSANVLHTSGISSVSLEYMPEGGSYSVLTNFNVSGNNVYSYTWDSDVAPGKYYFHYVAINRKGETGYSPVKVLTVSETTLPDQNNDVKITSQDRMVHIVLTVPAAVNNVGILLTNQTSSGSMEITGNYSNLLASTAPGNPVIHSSMSELLSDEEIERWSTTYRNNPGVYSSKMTQEIIIVKDDAYNASSNRKFHIYAVFKELGNTGIHVTYDDVQQPVITHQLQRNDLFGQMIDLVENIFSKEYVSGGQIVVASSKSLAKKMTSLSQAWTSMRFAMTLALVPVFDNAATLTNATVGFACGLYNGIFDGFDRDAGVVAEVFANVLYNFHPILWARDFGKAILFITTEFTNFKNACENAISNWVNQVKAQGETYVAWRYSQYSIDAAVEGYYYGYGLGTVSEFALVGWATSIIGGWVFEGVGDILRISEAGDAAVGLAVQALNATQKFKLRAVTYLMQEVQRATNLSREFIASVRVIIGDFLDELDEIIGDPKYPSQTYLKRMEQWDQWQELHQQAGKVIHTMGDDWIRLTPIERAFVRVEAKIGRQLSKEAASGLIKLHEFLWNNNPKDFKNYLGLTSHPDDIFLNDFLKVFTKADGTIHATALEESLAAYAVESDKLAFVIKRFSEIHPTYAYRYLGTKSQYSIDYIKKSGFHPGAVDLFEPPQVFIKQPSTREADRLGLQLKKIWNNDMKYRVRFRTSELDGDIRLTFCRNDIPELGCDNPLNYFEPCTRAYTTEMGSGSGGMVQLGFTTEKKVDLLEFFDETDGLWKPVSIGGN